MDALAPPPDRHRPHEDVLALFLGTMLVSLGLVLYAEAGLLTSGVAGLALLMQRVTGIGFGSLFFALNLPFLALAARRMGWKLATRTVLAVATVAVLAHFTPVWISIGRLEPLYAALQGGALTGLGLLALFRHRAGLGGTTLLALYLQENHGMRAGWVQLALDALLMLAACFVLAPAQVLLSLLGAVVLNLTVALNHKPGRYAGVS